MTLHSTLAQLEEFFRLLPTRADSELRSDVGRIPYGVGTRYRTSPSATTRWKPSRSMVSVGSRKESRHQSSGWWSSRPRT
jgi:hypothetical protein